MNANITLVIDTEILGNRARAALEVNLWGVVTRSQWGRWIVEVNEFSIAGNL